MECMDDLEERRDGMMPREQSDKQGRGLQSLKETTEAASPNVASS